MINIGHSVGGCSDFSKEIETNGYAIFSKVKARIPGYYPNEFPEFNDIDIDDVKTDDLVTVRAFF